MVDANIFSGLSTNSIVLLLKQIGLFIGNGNEFLGFILITMILGLAMSGKDENKLMTILKMFGIGFAFAYFMVNFVK